MIRRRFLAALVAAPAMLASSTLAGCSKDNSGAYQKSGGTGGFVAGDGSVVVIGKGDRKTPLTLQGTTFEGTAVDTATFKGSVVAINVWYAGCPPCQAEAPALAQVATEFAAQVHFVGINVRDEAGTAQAFQQKFGIPYQSIPDPQGKVLYQLHGQAPASAVPTTLLLDKQGRMAARFLGEADRSTLKATLQDLIKEAA